MRWFHRLLHISRQSRRVSKSISQSFAHAFFELQKIADIVIVEGVGGFLVPLNDHQDSADMAQALGLPVILVVGNAAGLP